MSIRVPALIALGAALTAFAAPQVSAQAGATPPAAAAAPAPVAPDVGQAAPDFSLPWADASGAKAQPITLSQLKGKVVVIAFYPKDRSSGCTAELNKFRDEFDSLFGAGVVVLPISSDSVESHASWAKDSKFPFGMASDIGLKVAAQYGSAPAGRSNASRTIFVVGKDGKIVYRDLRFNALGADAYTQLTTEVKKAKG
jgi:peroxiredoxin Q/BCP